jgi:hypothetical protein
VIVIERNVRPVEAFYALERNKPVLQQQNLDQLAEKTNSLYYIIRDRERPISWINKIRIIIAEALLFLSHTARKYVFLFWE